MTFPFRARIGSLFYAVRRLSGLRAPSSWLAIGRVAASYIMHCLSRTPVLLTLLIVVVALAVVPFLTPPIPCLSEPSDAGEILGALLAAQAAIAALTLAVTLFMMQGIRSRRDADDRTYREYFRRSWVRDGLVGSLLAVGVTGILLLSAGFVTGGGATADVSPEVRNYILSAGLAFFLNILLSGILFQKAIRQSGPDQWRALRRYVFESDVQQAVKAFLRRARRASDARAADESDFSALFPGPDEGSADQAVLGLLDEARTAMSERRHGEIRRSLDSLWDLVEYAMEQIKRTDIAWSSPGSQPAWPPLGELSKSLYSFREDVIRNGDREYILELFRLDYRLARKGMRERCGEMFTVGLTGYRMNYQIANRIGRGEFRGMIRDRFSLNASAFILDTEPEEAFPYASEMVRNQEGLLSDAMHSGQPSDYEQLDRSFRAVRRAIRLDWRIDEWPSSRPLELFEEIEQEYRIALMGLAGRALFLAKSNRLSDANPFVNVARQAYADLGQLTADIVPALSYDDKQYFTLWQDWETESAEPYEAISISTERYPLMFFALRLLELASDAMPSLDLRGKSQQILDWFSGNAESIEHYVDAGPTLTLEQRRTFAEEALLAAVRSDEIVEDYEIIGRNISAARVSAFEAEVCGAAFSTNSVERGFERAGVRLHIAGDAPDAPKERAIHSLEHKGFLTDTPEGALVDYVPLNGGQRGSALSNDVLQRFCQALEAAPETIVSLDSPAELLEGIDVAIKDLTAPEQLIIILAGDWSNIQARLRVENPEWYEASWKLPKSDRMGARGRYRGYPILSAHGYEDRCVYVVGPAGWGQFVRAGTVGGQDLRIEMKAISINRAKELLKGNSKLFADQPDEESKLRKLQTHVEIVIGERTGFRVTDPTRARRLVPIERPDGDDEASRG